MNLPSLFERRRTATLLAIFAGWPAFARAAEPPPPAPTGQAPAEPTPVQPPPPAPPPPALPPPVPPSESAARDAPNRQGFTLELGIGGALTFVTSEVTSTTFCFGQGCPITEQSTTSSETVTYGGLAPLSIGIGGFVSPHIALLFRATGSSYVRGNDQWVNAIYGGVVQYWPSDVVVLGAGAGAAVLGKSAFYSTGNSSSRTGFGFSLRAGVAVANYTHHSLRLAAEVLPAFYERRSAVGTTLVFEWQYF
jgi:hypothetical protein